VTARKKVAGYKAIVTLQSVLRTCGASNFSEVKEASVCVQSVMRAFAEAQALASLKSAAIVLQRHARGYIGRRNYTTLRDMRDASICVQSVLRAAVQAKKIAAMISAAIVLQSCARNYMKRKGAAVQIQAATRMWLAKLKAARANRLILCVQALARGRAARQLATRRRQALITVQVAVCAAMQRRKLVRSVAIVIRVQRVFRARRVSQQLRLECSAATCIQTWFRKLRAICAAIALRSVREAANCMPEQLPAKTAEDETILVETDNEEDLPITQELAVDTETTAPGADSEPGKQSESGSEEGTSHQDSPPMQATQAYPVIMGDDDLDDDELHATQMYVRADDDEDDEATQMYVEDCDDGATQMYNDDGATQVYVDDDFEEDNMAATQAYVPQDDDQATQAFEDDVDMSPTY